MNPGKNILIIQTAFIGDAILASAMLESLHAYDSAMRISLLVRKGNESLYEDHPFLHELLSLDKGLSWFNRMSQMIYLIRSKKYDVVFNAQRFMSTGILTAISGSDLKVGFDKNPLSIFFNKKVPHSMEDGRHEVERNTDLLNAVFPVSLSEPRLYPSSEAFFKVKRDAPYICMAPSSVWFTKQWPTEKWIELISHIPFELEVLLIGAPSDKAMAQEIIDQSHREKTFNLCGSFNLLESAALMQGALMNYVNDSAPMHLASSMDAPVSAIYCSTVPSFGFGPRSKHSFIFEVEEDLPCRPCGLHGKKACPLGHFNCSKIDPVRMVKESLS